MPFMWNERTSTLCSAFARAPRNTLVLTLVLAISSPLLGGCGAIVVAGVAAGAVVAYDRRDRQVVLEDQQIELQAMQLLTDNPDIQQQSRIAVTSYNLVVLLSGQSQGQEQAERFAAMVSRLPKVSRVVDEIVIGPTATLARESEDTLITSRVKLAISEIDLPDFDTMRVKVVTEVGVVYLMGLVRPTEADAAVEKARYVPGVQRVVKVFENYVPPPSAST